MQEELVSADQLKRWLLQARAARDEGRMDDCCWLSQCAWQASCAMELADEQAESGILLAMSLYRRGDFHRLQDLAGSLLPLLRGRGLSAELCELQRYMTLTSAALGDLDGALRHANEGYAQAKQLGDKEAIALALNAMGVCLESMGDPWQAERLMREAAALVAGTASLKARALTLNNLCKVLLCAHDLMKGYRPDELAAEPLKRALAPAREGVQLAETLGDPYALSLTQANLADVLGHLGQVDEARGLLEQVLHRAREHGLDMQMWQATCGLAELCLVQGDLAGAVEHMKDILADPLHPAYNIPKGYALELGYQLNKQRGRIDEALGFLERLRGDERRRSLDQLQAQSRFFISRLELEQERLQPLRASTPAGSPVALIQDELDPLTQLPNRHALETRLPALMREAEQAERTLTLALVDVDGLRAINQAGGLSAGDLVLKTLAQLLSEHIRGSDMLVRFGGDEFLIVFPDTVPDRAFEVCERLRETVELHPWARLDSDWHVTLSIGLACTPPCSADILLNRAVEAIERARYLGGNRVALV